MGKMHNVEPMSVEDRQSALFLRYETQTPQ